jgi:hypothetical protein
VEWDSGGRGGGGGEWGEREIILSDNQVIKKIHVCFLCQLGDSIFISFS